MLPYFTIIDRGVYFFYVIPPPIEADNLKTKFLQRHFLWYSPFHYFYNFNMFFFAKLIFFIQTLKNIRPKKAQKGTQQTKNAKETGLCVCFSKNVL
jgi:hypothetical protein